MRKMLSGSFLLVGLISCELIVDVPMPEFHPSMVMNSLNHTDTTFSIYLSQDRFILDAADFRSITGAEVQLYRDNQLVGQLAESDSIEGLYTSDHVLIAGSEYRITAEKEGYDPISATDIIPNGNVDAKVISIVERKDAYGDSEFKLTYSINDPPGENFYQVLLFKLEEIENWEYDEELDSVYVQGTTTYLSEWYYYPAGADINEFDDTSTPEFFSDELFDGKHHEISIAFNNWSNSFECDEYENCVDTSQFFLEIREASSNYYKYQLSRDLQWSVDGNPFAEPVIVYSNVENGYGIFGTYTASTVEFTTIMELEY